MILVTGGTGFIGQTLVRRLVEMGYQVRILLKPSPKSPHLPAGIPVEAVICGLNDERGLWAAMHGVDAVFHLASSEAEGARADLQGVDIDGTRLVAEIANQTGVERFLFLSHLGADRASAYPVFKAKGIAESHIVRSGVRHTILRSAVVFGQGDRFTNNLVGLLQRSPVVFLLPGDGGTWLQPIWVEDIVMALILTMEDPNLANQVISVGGPEYLTFRSITEMVRQTTGIRRITTPVSPAFLRIVSVWMENSSPGFPFGAFWQDYLAADRTTDLETLPRLFGLMPERFSKQLKYLEKPGHR